MKRIFTEKRSNIISSLLQELSCSEIASKNKVSIGTVTNISIKAHINRVTKKSARNSKFTSTEKRFLIRILMPGKEKYFNILAEKVIA